MRRHIREGEISFHMNKGRYINPYGRGTQEHNDYERGWSQALKKCPVTLLKTYKSSRV